MGLLPHSRRRGSVIGGSGSGARTPRQHALLLGLRKRDGRYPHRREQWPRRCRCSSTNITAAKAKQLLKQLRHPFSSAAVSPTKCSTGTSVTRKRWNRAGDRLILSQSQSQSHIGERLVMLLQHDESRIFSSPIVPNRADPRPDRACRRSTNWAPSRSMSRRRGAADAVPERAGDRHDDDDRRRPGSILALADLLNENSAEISTMLKR